MNVAPSTADTEYIATCLASCEAIWFWKLLAGLFDDNLCVLSQPELHEAHKEHSEATRVNCIVIWHH